MSIRSSNFDVAKCNIRAGTRNEARQVVFSFGHDDLTGGLCIEVCMNRLRRSSQRAKARGEVLRLFLADPPLVLIMLFIQSTSAVDGEQGQTSG